MPGLRCLFLATLQAWHQVSKARSPQTNGICERFHRTMKQEFYDVTFRKKLYHSLEELQNDVNLWLKEYNELRPHSGRYCYGKTPMQTFNESKKLAIEKQLDKKFEFSENLPEQKSLLGLDSSSTPTNLSIAVEDTVSIAPCTEVVIAPMLHSAKPIEAQKNLQLTDNYFVG